MSKIVKASIALLVLALLVAAAFFYFQPEPIYAADAAYDDACGTLSIVSEAQVNLHVRPARYSKVKTKLQINQMVNVCTETGKWAGVIVADNGVECRVADLARGHNDQYSGPCLYGWVTAEALQMLAG